MNEHDQRTQPAGRILHVDVFGNTPELLELAALDKARQFFGDDLQLSVIRDYHVWPSILEQEVAQGAFRASIAVQVVE